MKKISKIKLNQFSAEELDQRKMNALKGGCSCGACSCSWSGNTTWDPMVSAAYRNSGGSYSY